eukprot:gene7044-7835_t
MAPVYFMIIFFISLQFPSNEANSVVYKLVVTTADQIFAGTDDLVTFVLIGTKRNSYLRVIDNKLFDRNSKSVVHMKAIDIGLLKDIKVFVNINGIFINPWKLSKIDISDKISRYEAYFNYWFTHNNDEHYSRKFDLVSCSDGYYMGEVDGVETCKDVNECSEMGTNPCNNPHSYCMNLPGSYECRCEAGYTRDHNACTDLDECELDTNYCSQKCINTEGSYRCDCNHGFKLAIDGKTCIDVDECSEPNPCNVTTSACYDEYGSYRCVCKNGYTPDPNQTNKCVPSTCQPPTIIDENVILTPSRCMSETSNFNDVCHVSCKPGYDLDHSSAKSFKCGNGSFNGFERVDGGAPICKPKLCPKITPPKNAYTVPAKCSSVGTEHGEDCYIYCDNGLVLAGDRKFQCSMQRYNQDPSKAFCVKIPKIVCPNDVVRTLPMTEGTVSLGNSYPNYETNLRMDQVSSNIPGVGPDYLFGRGMTLVKYIATNEINQTDSCSFMVIIKDETPPYIEFCPDDQYLVVNGSDKIKMEWQEPRFKDNVGVKSVTQNIANGELRPPVTHHIHYTAVDYDGNRRNCDFKIHVKVLTCSFDSIGGGDQLILKNCVMLPGSTLCTAQCPAGKTFDIINSKSFLKNMWTCVNADFGITRMPDCVDYIAKNGSCPVRYVVTKNYRLPSLPIVCGKCPRGTFYNNGTCVDCPQNTFQDIEGSLSCKNCPMHSGSLTSRNVNKGSCKTQCPSGYYSVTGLDTITSSCKPCPRDTYSNVFGLKKCIKCPNGTSTEGLGNNGIHKCLYAPTNVTMAPSDVIEVNDGDHVQFDCYASGNPLPFMSMNKANGDANPENTHALLGIPMRDANMRGLRYMITSVSKHDADTYICQAENKKGTVYKEIQLKVNENSGSGSG